MGFAGAPILLQMTGKLSDVIFHGGWMGNGILLVLTILSVVSWTIMIEKARFFRASRAASARFLASFRDERSLKTIIERAKQSEASPEARLLGRVAGEIERGEVRTAASLDKLLESETADVLSMYESYLQFLASTASVSPLLGLFGTVWGIMASFLSMGSQGSASLFVVGPGIAVALITTIFGLGAAIPAVIGYNFILRTIRNRENELVSFSARMRNRILERWYTELQSGPAPRAGERVDASLGAS